MKLEDAPVMILQTILTNMLHQRPLEPSEWIGSYQENFKAINLALAGSVGLKARLRLQQTTHQAASLIRFSALMNDVSQVSFNATEGMVISVPAPGQAVERFVSENGIGFSIADIADLPMREGVLEALPMFSMPSDDNTIELLRDIEPLVSTGRVVPEPTRGLVTLKTQGLDGQPSTWEIIDVDVNSPFDRWHVVAPSAAGAAIPVLINEDRSAREQLLFDVTFPFIGGVSTKDLCRILDDEQDHLAQARMALKELVTQAGCADRDELINDVLRPKIDALERRFRAIARAQTLRRTGAFLGTAAMALTSYMTGGLIQAAAAVAGASGIGLIAKQEADVVERLAAAEEDPHFLLWRFKSLNALGE